MDGRIDWPALPFLAALHEVDDMELLARGLTEIRAAMAPASEPLMDDCDG